MSFGLLFAFTYTHNPILSIAGFGTGALAVSLLKRGKRHTAKPALQVRADDSRPPILLLRNFADDFLTVHRSQTINPLKWWQNKLFAGQTTTLEEVVAEELMQFGPVIAVAKPRRGLPPAGFARLWLDDEWKEVVGELMVEAQLVVIIVGQIHGTTDGFGWELQQLLRNVRPDRVVFVVPPVKPWGDKSEDYWKAFRRQSEGKLDMEVDHSTPLLTFLPNGKLKALGGRRLNDADYRKALGELISMKRNMLGTNPDSIGSD